jgi:transketolase
VAILATGVTLSQSLTAADRPAAEGIPARRIDAYSVKPIDATPSAPRRGKPTTW